MEIRGLTRSYGRRKAVDALDLNVRLGDVYGFLGPNGAGKTTTMRCILELIRRDAGEVVIFGERNLTRARRHVGAIVETPAFHSWLSGRQNLLLSCAYAGIQGKAAQAEVDRVLERVGLRERSGDKALAYSLGMKQRLAIARALLSKPKLMLLDEPTIGLDPRGMHEIREFIRSLALNDGITVFISSHLLAEVQQICNRVGIIQDGTLRAEGYVKELVSQGLSGLVVEVGTSDPDALKAALEAIDGVELLGPGQSGRLRLKPGDLDPAVLNKKLVEAGVPIDALVPIQRSLEDVFLELTTGGDIH
ncbi:MAG: ABC transporter ATP-binding protein [Deltaproteobacteria bacterium]|nr:ABC transporter ATP-binding protein [Deltaproteobacteria bacterium]